MTLTADQILRVALQAGFPVDTAVKMVAIALKESGGDSSAHNAVPPDDSYGLWQINMFGGSWKGRDYSAQRNDRMVRWGLSDPSDLFDPLVNAKAAFSLWGGNDANLATNWYIDRGTDQQRYQSYLPLAQNAAAIVAADPTGGGGETATGNVDFRSGRPGMAVPPVRPPASTLPPWPASGTGLPPQESWPPAWGPGSSSWNSSTSSAPAWWWWLVHSAGAAVWATIVHFFPAIATPAIIAAAILHGSMPAPPGSPAAKSQKG